MPMYADAHNDILTGGLSGGELESYIAALPDGGLYTFAVWCTEGRYGAAEILRRIERARKAVDTVAPFANSKIIYAIEDVSFCSLEDIELLAASGVRYASLTWNYENALAGGASSAGGLMGAGVLTAKKLAACGITIDTAHLNERSFMELLPYCGGRVICSHACFKGLTAHPRNISDEQARLIVDNNGFIGLALVGDFLCESGASSSEDAVRHIDYFVQKFGADGLGLGTDFFGTENLPHDLKTYGSLSILVEKLSALGYNDDVIKKIMYKNYCDFIFRGGI